ncbi:serum amyloid P-component-like [Eucyclogobius newberryi]|uniref:serum amyloid P-component-like n=1 Tax=Eucyclogobius newberryi TaxID=166745 RepID=UPI003B5ADD1B
MKFFICLVTLLSNAAAVQDLSGKMFIFPEETNTAHVKLMPSQDSLSAVTVCHRSFTDLTRDHALFSMATPTKQNEFLTFWEAKNQTMKPHIRNAKAHYGGLDYGVNKWNSICTTWDSSSGLVQLWLNGEPLTKKYITNSALSGKPIIILGQEQDSHGGSFDTVQSFLGMMSDVHMWDYVLSPCEILKYMKDKNYTPGNVVNWAALDFQLNGRVLIEHKEMSCKWVK